MKQNLPNPMRDALARQATPDTHPSSDVLTAFAERVLSKGENQGVTDHLSHCAVCREVAFLASSAAGKAVANEEDLKAAASAPRRRWSPRLVWSAIFAAVVLVVTGVVVQQRFVAARPTTQLASKMANAPVLPSTEQQRAVVAEPVPETAVPSPSRETNRKPPRAKTSAALAYDALGAPPQSATTAQQHSAAPLAAGNSATQELPTIVIGGPVPAAVPPAPHVNSFAASEAQGTAAESTIARLGVAPQAAMRSVGVAHPLWRITAEGHLEHFAGSVWTRVLAGESSGFRAVAVIGDEVWAGGNGGALFHSSDKGQKWGRVPVVTSVGTMTAAIVSIHFDDPQDGVVITEGGSRFSTNDGGITWTSQ